MTWSRRSVLGAPSSQYAGAASSAAVTTSAGQRLAARALRLVNRRWVLSTLSVIAALIVWQLVALFIIRDPVFLPTPVATAATWLRYLRSPYPTGGDTLIGHALISSARILAGFTIGTVVGVLLGAAMAGVRPLRAMIDPYIELTRPLPPLAFIPILIVWFGIGETPKIVLITLGVIPVMTVSTVAALDRVSQDMLNAARCLGASGMYTMFHVRIRAAMPHIITGMRLAMGLSWTSIVAVEMISATAGLGYVILQAGMFLNTSLIFAGIFSIAVLGISIDGLLRLLQSRLDPTMRG